MVSIRWYLGFLKGQLGGAGWCLGSEPSKKGYLDPSGSGNLVADRPLAAVGMFCAEFGLASQKELGSASHHDL